MFALTTASVTGEQHSDVYAFRSIRRLTLSHVTLHCARNWVNYTLFDVILFSAHC